MKIPRQDQLIINHWEEFDNATSSKALFNLFASYGAVWLKSDSTAEMKTNLFTALDSRGANIDASASDFVRAFIYENELYLDFIVILADSVSRTGGAAYINVFKDDGIPYILIGDGKENGEWDMTFYISEQGENPVPRGSNEGTPPTNTEEPATNSSGGGGGCNLGLLGMMGALMLFGMVKRYR